MLIICGRCGKCGSPKVMEVKLTTYNQQLTKAKIKRSRPENWVAELLPVEPPRVVGKVLTLSGWLCFWWLLSARHVTAGLKRPPASAGAGSHQLTQPTHWQPHTQGAATSQDDTRIQAAVGWAGPSPSVPVGLRFLGKLRGTWGLREPWCLCSWSLKNRLLLTTTRWLTSTKANDT